MKNIYKFLTILGVGLAMGSCTEGDAIIDTVVDTVDSESGAIIRMIESPLEFTSLLGTGNDSLSYTMEVQQGNGSFVPDFKEVRAYSAFYQDQDLLMPLEDAGGNGLGEFLLATYPAEDFSVGANQLPRLTASFPLLDVKNNYPADAGYVTPSYLAYRLELEMNDGTIWTNTDIGATVSGGIYFDSPFLFRIIYLNQIDVLTTYTADKNNVAEGDTVVYSITVSNESTKDVIARDIEIEDALPSLVSHVSDNGNGSYDPATGVWTAGNIAQGSSVTLDIVTTVNGGTGGETEENTITVNVPFQQDAFNAAADDKKERITVDVVIETADDDYSATIIDGGPGGATATVFDNDTLFGGPITVADVIPTIASDGGLTGVEIDANGVITVPAATANGTYTVSYQLCRTAFPANCSTSTATIVVENIVAMPDDFSLDPLPANPGGTTSDSVYDNDTIGTTPVNAADMTATITDDAGAFGISINADGTITVSVTTAPGTYTVGYQVCRAAFPDSCADSTVVIVVI